MVVVVVLDNSGAVFCGRGGLEKSERIHFAKAERARNCHWAALEKPDTVVSKKSDDKWR